MKALRTHAAGGPETLVMDELPDPVPGKGEVLVRVHACSINFPDTLMIRDLYQFRPERPYAPGNWEHAKHGVFGAAELFEEMQAAVSRIGFPCFVKPVMSSSGKGQSRLTSDADVTPAWEYALSAGRVKQARVIVEGQVSFDFEITQLTVRAADGTHFCEPIGHVQVDGDYVESWQPQAMSASRWTSRVDAPQ